MPLHPDAKALIGEPKPQPQSWDVAQVREDERHTIPLGGSPVAVASVTDLSIANHPDLKLTLYKPLELSQGPALVWFPGGGFVCPPTAYDRTVRRLCQQLGCDVYLAHYRLAPEHPFPAQFEDAPVLLRHAIMNHVKQGNAPSIHIGGDSSGGNVAASLVLHATNELRASIAKTCLVYPMVDASCSQPSYWTYGEGFGFTARKSKWYFQQWIAKSNICDPRLSPYWSDDLSGFGPCFLASAECDPLRDEGEAFAGRLIASGNPCTVKRYDGMIHGFFQMPGVLESGAELIRDIAAYLQRDSD